MLRINQSLTGSTKDSDFIPITSRQPWTEEPVVWAVWRDILHLKKKPTKTNRMKEKRNAEMQRALPGKAALSATLSRLPLLRFSHDSQPKAKWETQPLNPVGTLAVDDLDGAGLALNQLPSMLLSAWQWQRGAAHPNTYPATPAHGAAHAALADAISGRAISGQQSWALSVCLRHGSDHMRPRDDTATNPNKRSTRLPWGQSPFSYKQGQNRADEQIVLTGAEQGTGRSASSETYADVS